MAGVLHEDGTVGVPSEPEANRLYNKGAYGVPQSGGTLLLDLLEGAYLVETGRLDVEDGDGEPLALQELVLEGARRDAAFPVRYVVYRDLRERGHLVRRPVSGPRREDPVDLHLYPRGGFPGRTASDRHVLAVSEAGAADPVALLEAATEALDRGKRLLLGLVDEEGDLTYYHASPQDPRGEVPPRAEPLEGATAHLVADRVLVFDAELASALHGDEHLGTPLGPALQLSLAEALWLARCRGLTVVDAEGEALDGDALGELRAPAGSALALEARTYEDLRARHLVPKTGFKFGTHFRAYKVPPDRGHAPFLVHALAPGRTIPWPEVSGFVRLAASVRKRFLFAVPDDAELAYLGLRRVRP